LTSFIPPEKIPEQAREQSIPQELYIVKIRKGLYIVKIRRYLFSMSGVSPIHPLTKRYHHGDLRQALLDVGLQIVQEGGIDAVTLREVGRRAGVSHAAPYHHFPDKAALIEALAAEAFRRFTRVLSAVWEQSIDAPLEGLAALGETYVNFALDHPEEFRLMHMPGLRRTEPGSLSPVTAAAAEAYGVLRDAVSVCQERGLIPGSDPGSHALAAWSCVHGLAVLVLDGLLVGDFNPGEKGRDAVRSVIRILAEGLKPRDQAQQSE
jgi:AcrR family transcriptional regulator